jgi:hypothetical protein
MSPASHRVAPRSSALTRLSFRWNGSAIVMCTAKNAAKVSALRHNPAVALTIDTEAHPPHILLIRGGAGAGRRRRHPGRVPRDVRHLHDDSRATGRVRGRCAFALRRHGTDGRRADVGEADRLRDHPPERSSGTGPHSETNVSAPESCPPDSSVSPSHGSSDAPSLLVTTRSRTF